MFDNNHYIFFVGNNNNLANIETCVFEVMDGFSLDSYGSSSGGGSPTVNQETIQQSIKVLQLQAQIEQQEMLIQTINDKCFKMCIQTPGATVDSSQQKCLGRCIDRYVDAWNSISRSVTNKIRQQSQMLQE